MFGPHAPGRDLCKQTLPPATLSLLLPYVLPIITAMLACALGMLLQFPVGWEVHTPTIRGPLKLPSYFSHSVTPQLKEQLSAELLAHIHGKVGPGKQLGLGFCQGHITMLTSIMLARCTAITIVNGDHTLG
jgi:hypothetical protein